MISSKPDLMIKLRTGSIYTRGFRMLVLRMLTMLGGLVRGMMGALVSGALVTMMMGARVMGARVTGLRSRMMDTLTTVMRRTLFTTAMRRTPITDHSYRAGDVRVFFGILFGATFKSLQLDT